MARRKYKIGQVLTFKRGFTSYGKTAIVQRVADVQGRPYGTITTLIDLLTENGTNIQWPQSWVTNSFRKE